MLPRVLIIDDHSSHVRAMVLGLRLEGFEVESVSDPEAGLLALGCADFDLAMVDLMMPGTNGIQLARLLRDRHPRVRVVLTSAYHLNEPQLVRADCGAVGFVPKPFDFTELACFLRAKLSCVQAPSPPGAAA